MATYITLLGWTEGHIFWPDTKNQVLYIPASDDGLSAAIAQPYLPGTVLTQQSSVVWIVGAIEEIHARAANETGNEEVDRVFVNFLRRANLLQLALP